MNFDNVSIGLLIVILLFNFYTMVRDHIVYDFTNIIVLIIAILRLKSVHANQVALYSMGFISGLMLSVMFMKNFKKDVINGDIIKLLSCFGVVLGSYYISVLFIGFVVLYSIYTFLIKRIYNENEQKVNPLTGKISSILLLLGLLVISLLFWN
jgi:hypothetical protein